MSKAAQRRATQEAIKRKQWREAHPQPTDLVAEAKLRELRRAEKRMQQGLA